jgi:hypothetical protein
MEHWWNVPDRRKPKYTEKNLSLCKSVNQPIKEPTFCVEINLIVNLTVAEPLSELPACDVTSGFVCKTAQNLEPILNR